MDKALEIRRATKEDKDAVLKIHDHVYDGQDYLPVYYDYFLEYPDLNPFVVVLDGQIIGFEAIQKVDDGKTMVGRAKRVSPKYEGQGYMKQFSTSLKEWQKENNIEVIAFTCSDANPAVTRPSFQNANRLIQTRQLPLYCMDVLNTDIKDEDIETAKTLPSATETDILKLFSSQELKSYIAKEGRMIVDMVPLRMIDTNIRYMWGPQDFTTVFSDVRCENGKCRGLLSFGTVFPVIRHQFHLNLDIFGSDVSSLKDHIVRHLLVIREKVSGIVAVLIMVQEDFDMNELDGVFESFGVKRKIWYDSTYPELRYSQLYLYERDA